MTILLIEDTAEYAELVQHWLSTGDRAGAFRLNWTDSLVAGLNRLAQGGVDVILLDLGLPDSDELETFAKTKAHASGVPIIILSAADSESLALQMIQEGAADYLVKATCSANALIRAVKYAVVRQRSRAGAAAGHETAEPRALGVIGAKGGVGATTVACNLAVELRSQTRQRVLMADLNVNAGLVSLLFGLEPRFSLQDAIRNLHHLDQTCWDTLVSRTADDLHILPSPNLLGESELPADKMRQVLTLIRPYYDWMVLDLGRLDGPVMRLRDRLGELLIVTDTTIGALYETKRAIDALVKAGAEGDSLRLVLNQTRDGQPMSGSELNKIFGIPVYARLQYDAAELENACSRGRLTEEKGILRKQIGAVARKVAGLAGEQPRRGLPRLLSFTGRFRRSNEGSACGAGECL